MSLRTLSTMKRAEALQRDRAEAVVDSGETAGGALATESAARVMSGRPRRDRRQRRADDSAEGGAEDGRSMKPNLKALNIMLSHYVRHFPESGSPALCAGVGHGRP